MISAMDLKVLEEAHTLFEQGSALLRRVEVMMIETEAKFKAARAIFNSLPPIPDEILEDPVIKGLLP